MVARRRSTATRRSGAQRRKLVWSRSNDIDFPIAAGAVAQINLLGDFETLYGAQLIGCTVMRIRGWWRIDSATVEPVLFGIRVFSAGPLGTLPPGTDSGPAVNPHQDFMHYDVQTSDKAGGHYFDVRAKRKIDELSQGLLATWEAMLATDTAQIDYSISVLIALP